MQKERLRVIGVLMMVHLFPFFSKAQTPIQKKVDDQSYAATNLMSANKLVERSDHNKFSLSTSQNDKENTTTHQYQSSKEAIKLSEKNLVSQTQTKVKFQSGVAFLKDLNRTHLESLILQIQKKINNQHLQSPEKISDYSSQ